MSNVIQFSDIVANKAGQAVLASIDNGVDQNGHPVLIGDMGPLEFNAYTSEDGSYVIQIDVKEVNASEQVPLRIYMNDTTVYDSNKTPKQGA